MKIPPEELSELCHKPNRALPIKWAVKGVVKDLKYARDLSFYLLKREKADERPLVRLYEKAISPRHDRPVCLFCSFDKDSVVRENVYYYLNALMRAGFDIVFISSSSMISGSDLEKLSRCCIAIINRENKGYDFYGWKTALEKYPEYREHSGLLLANDSVLGPLFSIDNIIARLEGSEADIVGMTDSFRFYPHLQSYFLYCKKKAVSSDEFLGFFAEIEVLEFKPAIVRRYEVGFSRFLSRRFRLAALYSLGQVLAPIDYHQRPLQWVESTFHLWKPLITEFGFPFLKKSVLARRGVSLGEVSAVLAEAGSSYETEILNDWMSPGG
ncbi:MAG: Lipopolysaccharide biosynthesis protein-like protein [Nitrosospira multiformis]|jgi:rhamnosyltransferase|nr:Lipopolysaccharide biosynthesis protein-like protein [Nitrosospira multiformis]